MSSVSVAPEPTSTWIPTSNVVPDLDPALPAYDMDYQELLWLCVCVMSLLVFASTFMLKGKS